MLLFPLFLIAEKSIVSAMATGAAIGAASAFKDRNR